MCRLSRARDKRHEFYTNHADDNYHRALTKLGAKLKAAALADPQWFQKYKRLNT